MEPRLIETDVMVPDGIDRQVDLVEQLRKEDGIKDDQAAHALKLHNVSVRSSVADF